MASRLIPRPQLLARVQDALRRNPVVTLLGPRQCGKTTLARRLVGHATARIFDLEDPVVEAQLSEPMTALAPLRGLVVIDEVHRAPGLFPVLRVLADRPRTPARFLLLGSASPEIGRGVSESLAGRVAFVDMGGFTVGEVGPRHVRRLWVRGGLPRSFLARSEDESRVWRENFVRTFLERDVRSFGINVPPLALRRLWVMVAHYHGQVWNASEIGRSLGESHTTVRRHIDGLGGALVVRQLQPWFENVGKREVKSPKVYVRDSGLLHALLGIGSPTALEVHPKLGASWEGFVIEQVLALAGDRSAWFWGTQSGAELDLLLEIGGQRYGVEVKYGDAPRLTRSMRIAMDDLRLCRMWVVYPGTARYPLADGIEAIGLPALLDEVARLPRRGRARSTRTSGR